MAQSSDKKPADQSKPGAKSHQPTLTELPADQLDRVTGGQKIKLSDITITKSLDKSSP